MSEPLAMRSILLTFTPPDAGTPIEVNCQVAEVVLNDEAGDEQRYDVLCPDQSYVMNGPNAQTITIRGLQLWGTDGAARLLWDAAPDGVVAFVYKPFGNTSATADQPHWSGSFIATYRPQVGGEVGNFAEMDLEYPLTEVPELDDGTVVGTAAEAKRNTSRVGKAKAESAA